MTGVYGILFFFGIQIKPQYVIPDQVHCAVIRYHSRRVTCLEFHPTRNNILLSGDKVIELNNSRIFWISASMFSLFFRFCWSYGLHSERKGKLEFGILLKCMRRVCTETYTLYKLIICGKFIILALSLIVSVVILLLLSGVYIWKQKLVSFVESNFSAVFRYCRFSPTNDDMVYSASSDGTVGYTDLETGISSSLLNLNPDGWQVLPSPLFL